MEAVSRGAGFRCQEVSGAERCGKVLSVGEDVYVHLQLLFQCEQIS